MQPTILLIDDNAIQAATRQTILKRAGYFVVPVLSPQRALEELNTHEYAQDIDLVMTDHFMPGMSGADLVRELRKTHPELPVLVISGMEEAQAEYHSLNVIFRHKPLQPSHLLEAVEELLRPVLRRDSAAFDQIASGPVR